MSRDCFGNPTPGIPPSISDTFADIQHYAPIPLTQRLEYHYARVDAMIGREDPEVAWGKLRRMHLDLRRLERAREVTIITRCPPLFDRPYVGRYLHDRPDGGFVLEVAGEEVTFGPEYRQQLESSI